MEGVSVSGGTLDTLMVIVKQEEEETEEPVSDLKRTPFLQIKQEEEEEEEGMKESLGNSPACTFRIQTLKEDPDSLQVAELKGIKIVKKKKRRKKRMEAKECAPIGGEGSSGSGASDSLWRCRLCQRCFSSSWELTGHCCVGAPGSGSGDADGDPAKLEFWCPVCGDRFLRPTAFILHKRSHVGQSRYACGVCGRTVKTLRKLATHRRAHVRGPFLPHLCQDCSCSFRTLRALQRHRARTHGWESGPEEGVEPGEAPEGEDSAVMLSSSSSSNPAAPLAQPPQCLRCFMTFRDAETAERHLRFKHPAEYERQLRGRTVFACCVCDRTFPSSRLLSDHQRTHSKWRLSTVGPQGPLQGRRRDAWSGEECAEGKTSRLVTNGEASERAGEDSMRCRHCHIIFADPRTWGRHMTAKHPPPTAVETAPGCFSQRPPRGQPRPFSCSACGERFIQESSLTKHCAESHT